MHPVMMISRLVKFLGSDERQEIIARKLGNAERLDDPELWQEINVSLIESTRCCSFEAYVAVAHCHVMCVACAPENDHLWLEVVLNELRLRAELWKKDDAGGSLDAYEIGSLIGLFQAAIWLQKNTTRTLGPTFLAAMGEYCVDSVGRRCLPVNVSDCSRDLTAAQRVFDQAIKGYLRPTNERLAQQLWPEVRSVLLYLQRRLAATVLADSPSALQGPGRWLLDALVYSVLDVEHRYSQDLIPAALAVVHS